MLTPIALQIAEYYAHAIQALSDAGITPDSSKTYSLSDIEAALTKLHGSQAYVSCEDGSLNQVWYFYNVRGNAIDGQYEATAPRKYPLRFFNIGDRADDYLVAKSDCPSSGIKYVPKSSN